MGHHMSAKRFCENCNIINNKVIVHSVGYGTITKPHIRDLISILVIIFKNLFKDAAQDISDEKLGHDLMKL